MTIIEYIHSLEFDEVKFFQKKRDLKSFRIFKNGENQYYQESSQTPSYSIDLEEYEEKISSEDISNFKSHLQKTNGEYQISPKHHEILSVIQFLNKGIVQGQLNCNFLRSQFMTIENKPLYYSNEDIRNIYSWAKEQNYQIIPYRPAGTHQNMWKQFSYPNSFYFNSQSNVFETGIDLNLNSVNNKLWRLEIPVEGDRPTTDQLKIIKKFYDKRRDIRKMILDILYNYYQNTAIHVFMLPELNDQEQLLYFISSGSIVLSTDDGYILTIGFGTWDEEHGAYYLYFVDENRIEAIY